MKKFTGIAASPGIALGKALRYLEEDLPEIPRYGIQKNQIETEWNRLLAARASAAAAVRDLHERAQQKLGRNQADIFAAHLLMLQDPDFFDQMRDRLETTLKNSEWIVWELSQEFIQKMGRSPDPYLRERAADITDISRRLLGALQNRRPFSPAELPENGILVVHDLLPSALLNMDKERVKGLVMDLGSRTSHIAILARTFTIPLVLGLSTASLEIETGDTLALDGASGLVVVNPDAAEIKRIKADIGRRRRTAEQLRVIRRLPAQTQDGRTVAIRANISIPEEAEQALQNGAEGIGLYRSEFLFLSPGPSMDEDAQCRAYQQVLRLMGTLPVTIRTMDVGGDKLVPELEGTYEKNPLLGWRAVRFSLSRPDLFKTQLRAILRASASGAEPARVRLLFPLITGIEELEQALAFFAEAKAECQSRNQPFGERIEAGPMIEAPSAAMTADILAKKSDFFSIGTNDLVQYTLAVDRGNERVSYLAQPFHPAVLRLIKRTIDAAHAQGIPAAMCGELAGEPWAAPLLLGLGLDEFSMAPSSIPAVKRIIRALSLESCRVLAEKALDCGSHTEVRSLVDAWIAGRLPEEV
jgi:phosphotransferase system enzyme I (PtsI)